MAAQAVPPSVVMLHGWGGSFESVWRASDLVAALRGTGRTVFGIDILGHGEAGKPHDPTAYADLASRVQERVPSDETVDMVGFSLGAKIALELAARSIGRFRRLVAAGVGANVFKPEPVAEKLAEVLVAGSSEGAAAGVRALAAYARGNGNDPLAMAACLRRPPNPVLTAERLKAIACPTLLIAGDADALAQPLQPLADALAAAQICVLPGVDHLRLPQAPAFTQEALAFLEAR